MNSDSSENATPFPGYFKGIYVTNTEDKEEEDYNEYDNHNKVKYIPDNRLSGEDYFS